MNKQAGPTVTRRPGYTDWHCGLCQHHAQVMRKSGRDPIYEHFCTYPTPAPLLASKGDVENAMYIGSEDVTPIWMCPVLNKGSE